MIWNANGLPVTDFGETPAKAWEGRFLSLRDAQTVMLGLMQSLPDDPEIVKAVRWEIDRLEEYAVEGVLVERGDGEKA